MQRHKLSTNHVKVAEGSRFTTEGKGRIAFKEEMIIVSIEFTTGGA